jgi:hypothetical protein
MATLRYKSSAWLSVRCLHYIEPPFVRDDGRPHPSAHQFVARNDERTAARTHDLKHAADNFVKPARGVGTKRIRKRW